MSHQVLLPSATMLAELSELIYERAAEKTSAWPLRFAQQAKQMGIHVLDAVDGHDIQAAFCVHGMTGILVVRGTDSLSEGITNLFASLLPDPVIPNVSVHRAWGADVVRLFNLLESIFAAYPPERFHQFVTTGHSRGGAMAVIAAARLAFQYPKLPVHCVSHESPRAGDGRFAAFMRQHVPHLRWIRSGSIVPLTPLPFRFRHDVDPMAFDAHDKLRKSPGWITRAFSHVKAILAHIGVPGLASIRLHSARELCRLITREESASRSKNLVQDWLRYHQAVQGDS